MKRQAVRSLLVICGLMAGMLLARPAEAATYSVENAGSDGACASAWPPSIVGNYVENGTFDSFPRYDGPSWYIYRVTIFGAAHWVVSNTVGSTNLNNSTIAFYQASAAATPPTGTGYASTNSACGLINVVAGATATAPSAPTLYNLNTGSPPYISSSGQTTVYWSAVTGAIGYKLDVATNASFTSFVPGYNGLVVTGTPTPPTSRVVSGLTSPGTTYYFRVRAYNGVGDSPNSNVVSTTSVPATPTATTASTIRAHSFQANWNAQTGATSYKLYVCTNSTFTSCVSGFNPSTVSGTSASVSGLTPGTLYYYRLRASNVNGDSGVSNTISLTTNSLPVLGGTFTTAGTTNDASTIAPFSGVTVSDANGDNVSVTITYTAANGTLTGTGLSGTAGNYVVASAAPATTTTRLQGLVFHPTAHQGAPGTTVVTTFSLKPNDGKDDGTTNSSTVVTTTMTNTAPVFVGATTTLTVGQDSGANDARGPVHASDPDSGQTLTWTQQTAPTHGTLVFSGATASSGSADITPGGTISYQPAAGYSGLDSFAVQVGDGLATAARTVSVTVLPPPTVTVDQASGQADPANASPIHFTAIFNQAIVVSTFTASDVTLSGTATGTPAVTLTEIAPNDGTTFDIAVSGLTGSGTVIASITTGQVSNSLGSGNAASTSTDNTVTYDVTSPGVTVSTSASDPTNLSPIPVSIVFTEPVTGLSLAGLTVTNGTASNLNGSGASYTVDVTPVAEGSVSIQVAASSASDTAGNDNTASNTLALTYDTSGPAVSATNLLATYSGTGPSSFTVTFSEPVSDPAGSAGADDVTNTANYLLVEAGGNGAFDTLSCAGGVISDDTAVPISGITYDGGTLTATVSLASPLPVGTYRLFVSGTTSITDLAGNPLNGGADSTFDFAVNAITTTSVTSSSNPSAWGESVTFTATVATSSPGAGAPSGTVDFKDALTSATLCAAVPLDGSSQATCSTASLSVNTHPITVIYGGNGNFLGSTSSILNQVVSQSTTTSSVVSSGTPTVWGEPVTFTATVAPSGSGSGTPSGTVTFDDGGSTVCTSTLNGSGQATCLTAALSVGSHTIRATYGGDTNFSGSASSSITQNVNLADTTTTIVSSSNPSVRGESVTLTATVTAAAPGAGVPSGTVDFRDGLTSSTLCTGVALNGSSQATCSTAALSVATHPITVDYNGDPNFNPSTSAALGQVVDKAATTTTLASSVSPSVRGQSVTFTASVSAVAPGAGIPTGTATFTDTLTSTVICNDVPLDGSAQAVCATNLLSVATHPITVSYSGDTNFNPSTLASPLPQVVDKAGTTTSVASSANPSVWAEPVTFSATVTANAPGEGVPTGTVDFNDALTSTTICAAVPLDGTATATCTTSSLSVNTHPISVVYTGDVSFNGSTTTTPVSQVVNRSATNTTLQSSGNPSVWGELVTFTATVAPAGPGAGVPTGTVDFNDALTSATICSAVVLDGSSQATCSTPSLSVNTHPISVVYSGDGNFSGSTSAVLSQIVDWSATTTTLQSSVNPSVWGEAVTFTATVAPAGAGAGVPTGTVDFDDALTSTTICSAVVLDGSSQATCSTPSLSVNTHPISVVYSGDGSFSGSTSAVLDQVVDRGDTTSVVVSGTAPSVFGQLVTFTASVSAVAPAAGVPTGAVDVLDGTTPICSGVALDGAGQASCTTASLGVGSHSIAVTYSGDGDFNPSVSPALTQTVDKADTTTVVLSSPSPSVFGEAVTLTATVTSNPPGSGIPAGTATFMDGATPICTAVSLDGSGQVSCTTSGLAVDTHPITVTYDGSDSFNGSAGVLTHLVNKAGTTSLLISSVNPSKFGETVTLSASVSANAPGVGTPAGGVTFAEGGTTLCTAPLNAAAQATCDTSSLAVGGHPITVTYGGDVSFNGSASSALTQTVEKADTSATVTATPNPAQIGDTVTITVSVSSVAPGAGVPTGTIDFLADGTSISGCSAIALNAGIATCSIDTFLAGTRTLSAVYGGDASFNGSTSAAFTQTIIGIPDASLSSVTANPVSVIADGVDAATVTVTLRDVFGVPVPQTSVTLTQGTGQSSISASDPSDSSGVVTFTITSTHVEHVTYTAADATNGITISQTATVDFVPGPAVSFRLSAAFPTMRAGERNFVTVTAYDAQGRVASGYGGNHTLTFEGALPSPSLHPPVVVDSGGAYVEFGLPVTLAFDSGTATTPFRLFRSGGTAITATEGALATASPLRIVVLGTVGVTTVTPTLFCRGTGDAVVTLTGSGFSSGMSAFFNDAPRKVTVLDATTASLTLTASDLANSGQGTLAVRDAFGNLADLTSLHIADAPAVGITSPASVVAGSAGNTASVTTVDGATYTWSILGGMITAGQGTPSIVWTASSDSAAVISVVVESSCPSNASMNVAITPGAACTGTALPLVPAEGASVESASVALQWTPVGDATGYRVWMSIDGGAPGIVATTDPGTTTANVVVEGFLADWYVETRFENCASTFSPHVTFTIPPASHCDGNPALLSVPSEGASVTAGSVTFSWTAVPDGVEYELYASRDGGPQTMLASTTIPSATIALDSGPYEWFVRTIFTGCPATDSAPRPITVAPCDGIAATPIAPVNDDTAFAGDVTFSWSGVPDATGYVLWIGEGNAAPTPQPETTQTSVTLSLPAGNFNWFIQSNFACGTTASGKRSLRVLPLPAGCPDPSVPSITNYPPTVVAGASYVIRWSPSPKATYEVQQSRTGDFTDAVTRSFADAFATYSTSETAIPGARFYRARALSSCGSGASDFSSAVRVEVVDPVVIGDTVITIVVGSGVTRVPLDLDSIFANGGNGQLAAADVETFTVVTQAPWVTADPASGSLSLGRTTLLIDASMLRLGLTEGDLTITTSGGRRALIRLFVNLVTGLDDATPTPAAPDAVVIPAVGHAAGIGARFESDVRIANVSATTQTYTIVFTPSGTGGPRRNRQATVNLATGRMLSMNDVLTSWFGVADHESEIGALEIRPAAGGETPVVSSRTFAVTDRGTYGQSVPAVRVARLLHAGDVATLQHIAQSGDFRTNVGIVERSGNPATVNFTVFDEEGRQVGAFSQSIGGWEHLQLARPLAAHGITLADGRLEVRVTSDTGAVSVYASVLDNHTNDPLLVPAERPIVAASRYVLPGIAHLSGAGTSAWRSDVRLYNPSDAAVEAVLTFFHGGGSPVSVPITIGAGRVEGLDDVVRSTLGLTNAGGALHVVVQEPLPLVVSARTYNQTDNGTYGQFIPAVTEEQTVGLDDGLLQLLQLEQSDRMRTNLGIAEVAGREATVEIDLHMPDGSVEGWSETLAPYEFRQIDQILRRAELSSASGVRATVRVIAGEGRVTAYVSTIDNRTQDPTYIGAQ